MSTATSVGVVGMVEQPSRRSFVQGRGYTFSRVWRGKRGPATGLEQQLIAASYDVEVYEEGAGGLCTVVATLGARDDGSTETPVDVWEHVVGIEQKSLYFHPNVAGLGQASVNRLREALKTNSGEDVEPTGDEAKAYNHLLSGVEAYIVEQSVIRRTRIVSNRYARSVASANVGKIITTQQMKNNEGAPITLFLDDEEAPDDLGFTVVYGWRKSKPQMIQQAGNKWQIIFEYTSGIWSVPFIYQSATY